MKTRNGLVSNSSSSSFVFIGYKLTWKRDSPNFISIGDIAKKFNMTISDDKYDSFGVYDLCDKNNNFDVLVDGEDDTMYVGAKLADVGSDGDSLDNHEFDMPVILEKCSKAKDILKLEGEVKAFTGTRAG